MSKIFDDFPKLANKIKRVKEEIDSQLTTNEVSFNSHIKRYFNDNAKLLRPGFVLIAASYKSMYSKGEDVKCAAAAELLHVASLIHDDIIDNSKLRRGVETLNSEFDAGYAVICGDYLYAKSFELFFDNVNLSGIKHVGSQVTNMAYGEISQYLEKYNVGLDLDKYLDIISKKSASLFQSNLMVGAKLANVSKEQEDLLLEFGLVYGMMFQIQDDVLDYTNIDVYKPIHSDLLRGVYTLPVILCASIDEEFKEYILGDNIEFKVVLEYIEKSGALNSCNRMVENYYVDCMRIVDKINNREVKEYLKHVVNVTYRRV